MVKGPRPSLHHQPNKFVMACPILFKGFVGGGDGMQRKQTHGDRRIKRYRGEARWGDA